MTKLAISEEQMAAEERAQVARAAVLAQRAADAIWDKKGFEVTVLRVREIVQYTDYMVICSATSDRHAVAIADNVEHVLRTEYSEKPSGMEGRTYGRWVLLDYGDIVVHVFHRPVREYYQLERLYLDAPRLSLTEPLWVREVSPDALLEQSFDYGDELWSNAAIDPNFEADDEEASDDEADSDQATEDAPDAQDAADQAE